MKRRAEQQENINFGRLGIYDPIFFVTFLLQAREAFLCADFNEHDFFFVCGRVETTVALSSPLLFDERQTN